MSTTFIASAAEAYLRQALTELRLLDPKLESVSALTPGVVRLTTSPGVDRGEFLARLAQRPPIFVRHIHPVDAAVDGADAARLLEAVKPLGEGLRPCTAVAVQVRELTSGALPASRSLLRERLDEWVRASGSEPVTSGAGQVLSVTGADGRIWVGLSTPAENLSDWPGGEIRFRREEEQISRARFKLLEAFATWEIPAAPGDDGLDLGAAPGGWTSLLLEKGLRVTAVDTGELAPALLGHKGLTFLRQNVEGVEFPPAAFDLITCDISWNPLNTARLVARLGPASRPGAHLVLTVKLMLANPTRTIRLVGEALQQEYRLLATRQLFHNRDEVTMLLKRE